MIDIYRVPAQQLCAYLPRIDQDHLRDFRTHVARMSGRAPMSWDQALNKMSGATENQNGFIRFHTYGTCDTCHGRMFNPRTGRACHDCMGRRRVHKHVTQVVRFVPDPVEPQ